MRGVNQQHGHDGHGVHAVSTKFSRVQIWDASVEKEVEDPRDGAKGKVDDQKDQSKTNPLSNVSFNLLSCSMQFWRLIYVCPLYFLQGRNGKEVCIENHRGLVWKVQQNAKKAMDDIVQDKELICGSFGPMAYAIFLRVYAGWNEKPLLWLK